MRRLNIQAAQASTEESQNSDRSRLVLPFTLGSLVLLSLTCGAADAYQYQVATQPSQSPQSSQPSSGEVLPEGQPLQPTMPLLVEAPYPLQEPTKAITDLELIVPGNGEMAEPQSYILSTIPPDSGIPNPPWNREPDDTNKECGELSLEACLARAEIKNADRVFRSIVGINNDLRKLGFPIRVYANTTIESWTSRQEIVAWITNEKTGQTVQLFTYYPWLEAVHKGLYDFSITLPNGAVEWTYQSQSFIIKYYAGHFICWVDEDQYWIPKAHYLFDVHSMRWLEFKVEE